MEKMIFDERKIPPILGDSYDNEAFVPEFFNEVNYGVDKIPGDRQTRIIHSSPELRSPGVGNR
jgi:hypothetical protein